MDQTSPYSGTTGAPFFKVTIPALTLMFGLFGTGGNYTDDIHKQRTAGLFFPSEDREPRVNASAISIASEIEHIKRTLKLTVRELANCLGVSRQAIYDWKAGSEIKETNAAKLGQLKDAADVVAGAELPASPLLFQRRLPGGQTLLEAIASGRNGRETAVILVSTLQDEARRRGELTAKFAKRRPISENVTDDASALFSERG